MAKNITIRDLRPALAKVLDAVEKRLERYVITKRGKPVAVILSVDDYEGLIETLEVMSDKDLLKRLERAEADVKAGRMRSLDDIHRDLGLV